MSLQKKNPLIRAHVIVLVFWFILLFLIFYGMNLSLLARSMTLAALIMLTGFVSGISIWIAADMSRRDGILSKYGTHFVRGATVSIGDFPKAKGPKRGKPSKSLLASRFPWWAEYSKKYPKHADAFIAVLSVMYANPRLPASPVPGGHGGATLIEHSFNVVDTMMQMAPKWSYKGHKNKRGEISFPLLDSTRAEFRFAPDDPIIPLTAFAHDIGKTVCYEMEADGFVNEVRKNHDIEGAKVLRAIPEVMELPWKDRVALLTACEFYHHIGSIPYSTWIDDRARALVELLIAADVATGQREGGVIVNEYEDVDLVIPSVGDDQEAKVDDEKDSQAPVPASDTKADLPAQPPRATADHYGTAYDLAYSVLLEPGRVNGTNAATRIAWKHGEWLYISDAKLRAAVAGITGDSSYNVLPHRGTMHPFTLELMAHLASTGSLLQTLNGRQYSEKRAIYTTRSNVPGKTSIETKFVLVAKAAAFPGLEKAADCKVVPEIVECSWGETAAINKSGKSEQPAEHTADLSPAVEKDDPEDVQVEPPAKEDWADVLLDAAQKMTLPFIEKRIDGEAFLFFEEEIVRSEFPGFEPTGKRVSIKVGGKSGKSFVAVRK